MANCAQICKLSTLGGESLPDIVGLGSMVKFLMTVPMQRRYNWCGLKGKLKFGDLRVASVLCRPSKCFVADCHGSSYLILLLHISVVVF